MSPDSMIKTSTELRVDRMRISLNDLKALHGFLPNCAGPSFIMIVKRIEQNDSH